MEELTKQDIMTSWCASKKALYQKQEAFDLDLPELKC